MNGAGAASLPLFFVAGLLAFVFYLYREQLALVGRLLAISSNALWQNCAALIGGSLLLQAAGGCKFVSNAISMERAAQERGWGREEEAGPTSKCSCKTVQH
jgi:hypothetical protein